MRTQFICLAVAIVLVCSLASAQWVQTPLNTWRAYCFAVNEGNVFVGTAGWEPSNGIYLSTDSGNTWTTVNNGLTSLNITALVSSGPKLFAGSITGGVCRSTDNGSHWTPVNSGLTNNEIEALAVCGSRLFAGTLQGGVFVSTNDGTNWTQVNTGLTSMYISTIAVSDTVIFAGSPQAGVFRSTDNGTNWTAVNNGLTSAFILRLAVIDSCVFAGTGDSKVFRSTNSGASWTDVSIGPYGGIMSFAFYNDNVFAGTNMSGGVFLSTNNGGNWYRVGTGLPSPNRPVQALVVIDMSLLAGTYGSGVWRRPLSEMITSVDPKPNEVPREFSLSQNYPNPFNPSTTIQFAIPAGTYGPASAAGRRTSLQVFDVLGRDVATLVNEVKEPGVHTVRWDATGVSSGVYLCRLKAGSFVQTKRMMVVK